MAGPRLRGAAGHGPYMVLFSYLTTYGRRKIGFLQGKTDACARAAYPGLRESPTPGGRELFTPDREKVTPVSPPRIAQACG